ncbi:MAG: hypothetical protein U1F43_37245 [Myxococcota bacterium]
MNTLFRPMSRLDWQLIRPARPGKKHARILDEVEPAIEAKVHEATQRVLEAREVAELCDLEDRQDNATIASCEAAHAPRVGDDPDWETRVVDEYADADTEMELEEYLEMRRREFDCDRCPHASPWSLHPQDPCEISVGVLDAALHDDDLRARLRRAMGPDDMTALATDLETAQSKNELEALPEVDVAAALQGATRFLRFWARLGFGVRPELVSELEPIQTPDGPIGPDTDVPVTLH